MEYHIGKYLTDAGIVSNNIFYNRQPDTDNLITTIYSESVPVPDYAQGFNSDLVGIKFLTRAKQRILDAKKLAWDIHRNLAQLGSIEITTQDETVWIVSVDIVNVPTFLEIDHKDRATFVSHYSVHAQTQGNIFRRSGRTLAPNAPELLQTFDSTFDHTFA